MIDSVFVSSSAPDKRNERWGDFHFVDRLAAALGRQGAQVEVIGIGEAPDSRRYDHEPVILRVAGPHLPDPVPGAINLVWQISHPELCLPGILGEFDAVFIASEPFAAQLQSKINTRLRALPQATDWAQGAQTVLPLSQRLPEAIFVGNARGKIARNMVKLARDAGIPFKVVGNHWEGRIPAAHILGEYVPNADLPALYGRYAVALNDHWGSMKIAGFINNRLYDTLACGAAVLCDDVEIPDPELRALVPQVRDGAAMRHGFDQALARTDGEWAQTQARAARLLQERYSFDHAARVLLSEVAALRAERAAGAPPAKARPPAIAPDTDPLRLAQRILAVADRCLAPDPAAACRPEAELPPMPINEMTACYRDLSGLAARYRQGANSPQDRIDLLACRAAAARYIARSQKILDVLDGAQFEDLRRFPVPRDLAGRRHNRMFSYPGVRAEPIERNRFKPFIRMAPLQGQARPDIRFATVLHAYYTDVSEHILRRLTPIREAPIFISTDRDEKARVIQEMVREMGFAKAELRVFPNRGRDVFPRLFGFADILDDFDCFLHLHSKKSLHANKLSGWLASILGDIAADAGGIHRILSLFHDVPRLGLLYPRSHVALMSHGWEKNREIARELGARLGLGALPEDGHFRFPAGSMFWARAALLKKVASLGLTAEDFPPEAGQLDGTVAHALERLIGVLPEAMGLDAVCFTSSDDRTYRRFGTRLNNNKQFEKRAGAAMKGADKEGCSFPTANYDVIGAEPGPGELIRT